MQFNLHPRDLASLAGENTIFGGFAAEKLERLQAELEPLSRRYDIVVANPPYMGSKNMNKWLGDWVKKHYKDVKGDLFSCFMVRNVGMGTEHAQLGFMTPYVWMFIGTYEKLRKFVIQQNTITSLIQLEYSGFSGATVPICTFTLQKGYCPGYRGGYVRLSDFVGVAQQAPRALEALANPDCGWYYRADASGFKAIPGSPIAYWASKQLVASFICHSSLKEVANPVEGIKTGDNDRHLRLWFEVSRSKEHLNSSDSPICLWRKMCKGGEFRKWYGNNEYVCRWGANGAELFNDPKSSISNKDLLFKPAFNWTYISSGRFAARRSDNDSLYNNKGPACYSSEEQVITLLGAMNSSYAQIVLDITSPTLDYKPGGVGCTPIPARPVANVNKLVLDCVAKAKVDWDAYETSWDFTRHPLA